MAQWNLGFREIALLKDQSLGIGSYGSVFKAMCDDLVCAAKIIHPTLAPENPLEEISPQREHRLPMRRFITECDLLRDIRHPNIIQYLGMYRDPETGLPVLLMELMDESLTHFLENSGGTISFHIQVVICHDVSKALSFLHLNDIIHRDLSSNNILLAGKGSRAKLTDFGMAKLIQVHMTHLSNTTCPGTDVYMPPEAVDDQAVFTERGDIFSFGVNIIQVLTKKFPKPGDRHVTLATSDPRFPAGKMRVCVGEVERRQNHISEIVPNCPLLPIALQCLNDEKDERPTSSELCQRLAVLRTTQAFTESAGSSPPEQTVLSDTIHDVGQQQLQVQRIQHLLTAREQELRTLREDLIIAESTIREKDTVIASRDEEKRQYLIFIDHLQRMLYSRPQLSSSANASAVPITQTIQMREEHIQIRWSQGRTAPSKMDCSTEAVIKGSVAYFRPAWTECVYSFESTADIWSQLPDCRTRFTTLAIINGLLTTIGGVGSNQLFSFVERDRAWREVFPPMPTARSNTVAVCTGLALIVAGGLDEHIVEIMNTESRKWCTATNLPISVYNGSSAVCNNTLYISEGRSVITCSLSGLLQSCRPKIFDGYQSSTPSSVWTSVADLPFSDSSLATVNNHLFAIGGIDDLNGAHQEVQLYDPVANSWSILCSLNLPRSRCFSVVLPQNRIMVVGGLNSLFRGATDTVEFGTVV